jgi:hypothetical protein
MLEYSWAPAILAALAAACFYLAASLFRAARWQRDRMARLRDLNQARPRRRRVRVRGYETVQEPPYHEPYQPDPRD